MKLSTFAISKNDWDNQIFSVVTQQAKDSARKIQKGIDVGMERKRFNNACNRIEMLALQKGKEVVISEKSLQDMLDNISSKSPILFPFVEHDNLKSFTQYFDDASKKYLTENQAAIVFLLKEFSQGAIKLKSHSEEALTKNMSKSNVAELNKVDTMNIADIKSNFHKQILTAVEKGTPIGWINIQEGDDNSNALLRHEGIITCLREHVFAGKQPTSTEYYKAKERIVDKEANEKRNQSFGFQILNFFVRQPVIMKEIYVQKTRTITHDIVPRNVQFAFSDGSISDLFPLYSMVEIKPKNTLTVIKTALISNRHFELDNIVETCILRNSEISRRQEATIADQEKLSFEIAQKFFNEILEKTEGAHIELYHTGLEPSVIGTYRAFLSTILKKGNRGKLVITPKLFKGGDKYSDLKQWY
ncbi:MAG: hypothetical protein KDE33_05950 [Bacteroidetes bacterium]|nr:hypothetical protein [Bacteroidota bacterium]